jgi:hypothetical protein
MYLYQRQEQRRETTSQDEDWSVFFYKPSLPAAIVFAALYIIPFAYHLYISFVAYRHGKYFRYSYSVPLLLAAIVEINGYSQRVASTQSVQDIGTFATSQTMIVLAPVLVCASLYILLSRIILSTHPEDANEETTRVLCGALKVTWLPKLFITLDVGAMVTQGGGSAVSAAGEWKGPLEEAGTGILIGGLALQLATFAVFLLVVIRFHCSALREGVLEQGMLKVIHGVYIAGFFIMVSIPALAASDSTPNVPYLHYEW